jgi:hypothetical protein
MSYSEEHAVRMSDAIGLSRDIIALQEEVARLKNDNARLRKALKRISSSYSCSGISCSFCRRKKKHPRTEEALIAQEALEEYADETNYPDARRSHEPNG